MDAYQLEKMAEREVMPGFHGRFVHGDKMTLAFWQIDAGASAPTHQHPHEQVFHLFEGRLELTVAGAAVVYEPGAVVVIPSNVPHAARAITSSRVLDIFHPVREDMR